MSWYVWVTVVRACRLSSTSSERCVVRFYRRCRHRCRRHACGFVCKRKWKRLPSSSSSFSSSSCPTQSQRFVRRRTHMKSIDNKLINTPLITRRHTERYVIHLTTYTFREPFRLDINIYITCALVVMKHIINEHIVFMCRDSKDRNSSMLNVYILTDHLQVAHLTDHRIRIDLTHVEAAIFLLDLRNVQRPCVGIVKAHRVARNTRYDLPMNGDDHLTVDVNPGHLIKPWIH